LLIHVEAAHRHEMLSLAISDETIKTDAHNPNFSRSGPNLYAYSNIS
jgi:hypothetical protein